MIDWWTDICVTRGEIITAIALIAYFIILTIIFELLWLKERDKNKKLPTPKVNREHDVINNENYNSEPHIKGQILQENNRQGNHNSRNCVNNYKGKNLLYIGHSGVSINLPHKPSQHEPSRTSWDADGFRFRGLLNIQS